MRRYRYRSLFREDVRKIMERAYGKTKAEDILSSYHGKEMVTALIEDRNIEFIEEFKKENLKWYNILIRFTFPLLLVFIFTTWAIYAIRWCFTGMRVGFKHGSKIEKFLKKWNKLGKFDH